MKVTLAILICGVAVCIRASTINHVNEEIKGTVVPIPDEIASAKQKRHLHHGRDCQQNANIHHGGGCQGGINTQVSGGLDIIVAGQTNGNTQTPIGTGVSTGQVRGGIDIVVGGSASGNTPISTGVSTSQVGGDVQIVGGSSAVGTGVAVVQPVKPTVSGGHYAIHGKKHHHHHYHSHHGHHGAGVGVNVGSDLLAHKRLLAHLKRKLAKKIAKLQAISYLRPQSCSQTVPCSPCRG